MKLLFANAEGVLEMLTTIDSQELPIGLFAAVRKVLLEFKGEVSIYFSKKEKILQEFCTLEKGDGDKQYWRFPAKDNERFQEFNAKWIELMNVKIEFNYKPIDYLEIIEKTPDEAKKRITIKGKDFDVLDYLNEVYKVENTPAEESTSAGANNGSKSPAPDAL